MEQQARSDAVGVIGLGAMETVLDAMVESVYRLGDKPATLYEVVTHSAGNSWVFGNVPHILEGNYTPLSAVDIFAKDFNAIHQTGCELALSMPLAASALQQFTAASGAGCGREGDAAVIKIYQRLSGIALPAANDEPGSE